MPISIKRINDSTKMTKLLLFLVDQADVSIAQVHGLNNGLSETLPFIRSLCAECEDYYINVLEITDDSHWMYDKPIDVNEFVWIDIVANGHANLGAVFIELDSKLSRTAFVSGLSVSPCILLISGRKCKENYLYGFDILKQNKWFQVANKLSFAVGTDVDRVLSDFARNRDSVFSIMDIDNVIKNCISGVNIR